MSTNGINDAFKNGINFKLQDRSPKGSGLTYELKNIFEQMEKAGIIKDKGADGLTKKEALNMYNALNKIHQETGRSQNYTTMKANTEFTYDVKELTVLAQAAGYEIVSKFEADDKPVVKTVESQNLQIKDEQKQKNVIENNPGTSSSYKLQSNGLTPPPADVTVTEFGDNSNNYTVMTFDQKMAAIKTNDIKDIAGLTKNEKLPDNFEVKINNINNEPVAAYYLDGKEIKGEELSAFIDKLKVDTKNARINAESAQGDTSSKTEKTRKELRTERREARKDARAAKHAPEQPEYVRERGATFKTEGMPDRLAYSFKDFVGSPKDVSKMSKADIIKLNDGELVTVNNAVFIKEGDRLVSRGETNALYAGEVYYSTEAYSISNEGKPDKLVKIANPLGEEFVEYQYNEAGKKTGETKQKSTGEIIRQKDYHDGYNIVDGKFKDILGPDGAVVKTQLFNQFTALWDDVR